MSATASPNSPADPRLPVPRRGTSQANLGPDCVLDARRALYFRTDATLVIADLHLGYAWIQRRRGSLLPLAGPNRALDRLSDLLRDYPARRLVVLGDLVHQAVALPAVKAELTEWMGRIPRDCELTLCAGNHDRGLAELLAGLAVAHPPALVPSFPRDRYLLHHGDRPQSSTRSPGDTWGLEADDGIEVIGHEHPSLRLGDGVATEAKVPCFLIGDRVWVLPAFSDWAAGCELGRQPFLGETARNAVFHSAYACLGPRLLRIPLRPGIRTSPSQ